MHLQLSPVNLAPKIFIRPGGARAPSVLPLSTPRRDETVAFDFASKRPTLMCFDQNRDIFETL